VSPCWLRQSGDDVLISLHVQPGARKTEVAGEHGEALKIRLAAPPVDGKANDCLIAFLARQLDIAKARLELVSGVSSRTKRVRAAGLSADFVVRQLAGKS
jgi:uncharacterized protein